MSEEEDIELQALERQLDDAFQTTRPRPAFEDELWLRMQSRRPVWQRVRDSVSGFVEGLREAPAVPSAAIAILLVVLIGAGIFRYSGLHLSPGGGASTAAGPAQDGVGKYAPNAAPRFGNLPPPALAPGVSRTGVSPSPPSPALDQSFAASPNNIYFGPAVLSWTGQLDVTATNLPVFRYQEPTPPAADQFAASLGAARAADVAPGGLGVYSGNNFTLVVVGSVAQPVREPAFNLSEQKSAFAPAGGDPVAIATARLAAHSLLPPWPYQTEVQKVGTTVRVRFLRSFDLQAQGQAGLVDSVGDRYGIEVDLVPDSSSAFETGPLPLSLDSANYPIINVDQAVRFVLASSSSSGGTAAVPVVRLTKGELVYILVWAGDHGFYEPAFLFSGTFINQGSTYVKRVLVPAVSPTLLSH